jgi:CelD/BcsL family acetyltransferase involved in cellulose biosynthesis
VNDEDLLRRRAEAVHADQARPLAAVRIEAQPEVDLAQLGAEWCTLEQRAQPVFFRRWSWVGSLAKERFGAPLLVRASLDGQTIGLALFNRRSGRLALTESGEETLDAPFIEHNGPLLDQAAPTGLAGAMLRTAWRTAGAGRLQLGGVAQDLAVAAGGVEFRRQERPAPYVDLAALRAEGRDYLNALSANTRYQLRRSVRHYAQWGPPRLERAADPAQAVDWLAALIELHDAMWRARGLPGAFASDYVRRFHRAVIVAGVPRGEVDLLRCTAGERLIGYLYNVRGGGRVLAYQGGFVHADTGPHGKPGLTCHLLAIEQAMADGEAVYDFLAGDTRYKRSLTTASETLAWVELVPCWSPLGILARLRGTLAT